MATAILDGLTQATAAVQHGITTPLKQVSCVINGLRAGLDVLRKKDRLTHFEGDGSHLFSVSRQSPDYCWLAVDHGFIFALAAENHVPAIGIKQLNACA